MFLLWHPQESEGTLMKAIFVAASVAAIVAAAPAWAQTTSTQRATPPGGAAGHQLSQQDRDFLAKASAGGKAEVEAGQLAQQKASEPSVKKFGEHMVKDHSQGNQQLMSVAQREGITMPSTSTADRHNQQAMSKLQSLSGRQFDQAYVQDQLRDHQETVALFEKEAQSGENPGLKSFAQQSLPMLREHLAEVQQLASGSSGTSTMPEHSHQAPARH